MHYALKYGNQYIYDHLHMYIKQGCTDILMTNNNIKTLNKINNYCWNNTFIIKQVKYLINTRELNLQKFY